MKNDLSDRLMTFGAAVVRFATKLERTIAGRHVSRQMLRCATSAGANYEEACAGETRADFIHKLQIVLKELRECLYWLRLTRKAGLFSGEPLDRLEQESLEFTRIIGKSVSTAKSRHT